MDIKKIKSAVEAYNRLGNQRKAADELGINERTLRRYLSQAAQTGNDGLSMIPAPYGHNVKGVSTLLDGDGNIKGQWIKTKVDGPDIGELAEYFEEAFKAIEGRSNFHKPNIETIQNRVTIYPLADLHIGMLSWGEETGDDYDLKIAKRDIVESFRRLVDRSEPTEECLIANLGDAIHINDSKNATPASHHILDVDGRYQKVIYTAVEIFVELIDIALSKHKKITFRNVKGNHDPDATVSLNIALKMWAKNDSRVSVDDSPKQFKAHKYGKNLIGTYHGHTMKPETAAMNLAVEYPQWWGETKFRMVMHGHYHHQQVKEVNGVAVEMFNTISARDAYSAYGGYGSRRRLTSITLDYEEGEVGRAIVSIT